MKRFKKAVFTSIVLAAMAAVTCQTGFATCYVGCSAICRYTCQVDVSGSNCNDAAAFIAVRECCAAAFENTPGINDVPCTSGGPEN